MKQRKKHFTKKNNLISDQKGSALVIVLLLVAMITTLVVEFAYEIYADTSSVANWTDAQKASIIAKSGQAFSSEFLKEVKGFDHTYTREITIPVPLDFGPDSFLVLKVEDENSKFNINSIVTENGKYTTATYDMLIRLLAYLDIDVSVADIIADWIDQNSLPRYGNSEENAKNSPLWSVDELKHIEGIDTETYNKLSPYITVHSDDRPEVIYRININTAELPVLMSLYEGMTETIAENIMDYRAITPFEDKSDLNNVSGLNTANIPAPLYNNYLTILSSTFRIHSIATSHEIKRVIESVIDTSLKVHYWREG